VVLNTSVQGPVAGSCEHSDVIEDGNVLECLTTGVSRRTLLKSTCAKGLKPYTDVKIRSCFKF
jgi:hypothetical protein